MTPAPPRIWSRRTLKLFLRDVQAFLQLPPKLNVWQWAARNIFLSSEVTPEAGFYNPERLPYQKRIQEWMTDPHVNDIIVVSAAQLLKTTVINNGVGYFVAADPSSILVVYPTIDDGKDWMADKFMPMCRSSPTLRKLIPDQLIRTIGQTTLIKHFPGGRIKVVGSNSPSALRGRSFRIVVQDDLDGFTDNVEGDPSAQADKRAANQPRALRMKFSTPTIKGTSRIWKWLQQSTFDQLLCPCPKCDRAQTLEWSQVIFDPERPEEARYKCVNAECGHLWDDRDRYNAVLEGVRRDLWTVRNPKSRIKGLHMNGLYRLMGEKNSMVGFLEEWVRDYLAAKAGGEKTLQVWINTFLAECYEPASETIEPDPLFKRRENYRPTEMLPEEVLVVVAAVDVQSNRLECEVRGIGLGQESWGIEYQEFAGDPTEQLVWKRLDGFLGNSYRHPVRGKIRISQCFVDAGGSKQNEAYIFTETRNARGIYACRGAKDPHAPNLSPLRKAGYNQVPFYFVGTQAIKDTLHSRLLLKKPGPGYFHWPISDDYDEGYFKKLTAEKKVMQSKGKHKGSLMWQLPEGARNEPWDINVYIVAAIEAAGFTERHLRMIARDNERIRVQQGLPPKPPSQAINLDALKEPAKLPDAITMDQLKAAAAPAALGSAVPAAADPTAPQNAPAGPKVDPNPKKTPWKVVGKGRQGSGLDFGRWGF